MNGDCITLEDLPGALTFLVHENRIADTGVHRVERDRGR